MEARIDRTVLKHLLKNYLKQGQLVTHADYLIAKKLGSSPDYVARIRRQEFGMVFPKGNFTTAFSSKVIQEAYDRIGTVRGAAEKLGVDVGTILRNANTRSVQEANRGEHLRKPILARNGRKAKRFESAASAARNLDVNVKTVTNSANGITQDNHSGWKFSWIQRKD